MMGMDTEVEALRTAVSRYFRVYDTIVHPFAVIAAPAFLLVLILYLVMAAFDRGFYPGVRSFAGVLFPLVMVAFVFVFQREFLATLARVPTFLSFLLALGVGAIAMVVIQLYARSSNIPITELVLSASFSVLVFGHASQRGNKVLSYYYGMISGVLLYIIFVGFPALP